jgi:predicted Na+-dependent transporter
MRLVTEFLRHVVPGVIRPVRVLWNELIGFLFLVIAVFVGASTYRRAHTFGRDAGGILIVVISALFAVLLAGYGISSFLKARKISRS